MFWLSTAMAASGDYSLRLKGGPSFSLHEWNMQGRFGGEFDYDFGYSLGFNLQTMFGVSDKFRYDLIPSVRVDYLYLGPAYLYGIFGVGLSVFDRQAAMDLRFGTGMTLPLGDSFEFNTDVNLYVAPVGLPVTPVTLDWLMGFGFRFH